MNSYFTFGSPVANNLVTLYLSDTNKFGWNFNNAFCPINSGIRATNNSIDSWHHIALVKTLTSLQLYINGSAID